MEWMHGYNAEQGYTYGFYRELDPGWLELIALIKGRCPPSFVAEGKLRYLELGCGQGYNLCLLAVCHPDVDFIGIDFNPQHIAHANFLAKLVGLQNIKFIEGDFLELSEKWPENLGKFHYVSAHGVLSWISKPVREALYRCINNATMPGSIVYLSYNTFPGWLSGLPVQHLLKLWQDSEKLNNIRTLEVGYKRLKKLLEINSLMCRAIPGISGRIDNLNKHDVAYLIQEYLHSEWRPLWFNEVAHELTKIKLNYVGTANAANLFIYQVIPDEWKNFLNEFEDLIVRETIFDVLINQSFRRDIWIRGSFSVFGELQVNQLMSKRFFLLSNPTTKSESDNPYKFQTSLGEVSGKPEYYAPLYSSLKEGPKSIRDLISVPTLDGSKRSLRDLLQAIGLMLNAGHIVIYKGKDECIEKVGKKFNRTIIDLVSKGGPYRYLIMGIVPCVIQVGEVDMIIADLKLSNPKENSQNLSYMLIQKLQTLGKTLMKDGKPITEPESLRNYALELVENFLKNIFPLWQRMGII